MRELNVLSLFDGISCGQLALERANIKVKNYFASEIDRHAIKVTQTNHPNTIQLGDVATINVSDLPNIDLLIGGSPCQDLSIANRNRKGLKGERSKLFWEYVRILKEIKPKYFLLENVNRIRQEDKDIITQELGVKPIMINSSLVSGQFRERLYWTNIPNIKQPANKSIYLKDIIEYGYYDGSDCVDGLVMIKIPEMVKVRKYPVDVEKLKILLREHKKLSGLSINQISEELKQPKTLVEHWFRTDSCFSIPSEDIWFNLKELLKITTDDHDKSITQFEIREGNFDMSKRVYKINGKAPTLTTITGGKQRKIIDDNYQIREITPLECERLQTLPDGYTTCISKNQRYKVIGNGWTVDVIAHILSFMKQYID